MEKTVGRPPIAPEDKRTKVISVAVTPYVYEGLQTLREMSNTKMAHLTFDVLKRYIQNNAKAIELYRAAKKARVD